MEVANVTDFASTPHFDVFEQLLPERGEVLVRVRAAAISNLVKAQTAGKHYSSGTTLPSFSAMMAWDCCQTEGMCTFFYRGHHSGSLRRRLWSLRRIVFGIPDGLSDEAAAALGNPGMASWAALLGRARFLRGESVLVNGATGVAGQQAV